MSPSTSAMRLRRRLLDVSPMPRIIQSWSEIRRDTLGKTEISITRDTSSGPRLLVEARASRFVWRLGTSVQPGGCYLRALKSGTRTSTEQPGRGRELLIVSAKIYARIGKIVPIADVITAVELHLGECCATRAGSRCSTSAEAREDAQYHNSACRRTPRIMNVAWLSQHSPTLGQCASSQTGGGRALH